MSRVKLIKEMYMHCHEIRIGIVQDRKAFYCTWCSSTGNLLELFDKVIWCLEDKKEFHTGRSTDFLENHRPKLTFKQAEKRFNEMLNILNESSNLKFQ